MKKFSIFCHLSKSFLIKLLSHLGQRFYILLVRPSWPCMSSLIYIYVYILLDYLLHRVSYIELLQPSHSTYMFQRLLFPYSFHSIYVPFLSLLLPIRVVPHYMCIRSPWVHTRSGSPFRVCSFFLLRVIDVPCSPLNIYGSLVSPHSAFFDLPNMSLFCNPRVIPARVICLPWMSPPRSCLHSKGVPSL